MSNATQSPIIKIGKPNFKQAFKEYNSDSEILQELAQRYDDLAQDKITGVIIPMLRRITIWSNDKSLSVNQCEREGAIDAQTIDRLIYDICEDFFKVLFEFAEYSKMEAIREADKDFRNPLAAIYAIRWAKVLVDIDKSMIALSNNTAELGFQALKRMSDSMIEYGERLASNITSNKFKG